MVSLLLPVIYKGVWWIAVMFLASSILNCIIIAYPNKKLVGYGWIEQFADMLPILAQAIIMGIIVYCIKYVIANLWIRLFVQIIVGAIVYILEAILFKMEPFYYVLRILKNRRK